MIVDFVSRDYMSVTLEGPELFRVLSALSLDIKVNDVCKVSVNILLWPLTDDYRNDKHKQPRRELDERSESLELFPQED